MQHERAVLVGRDAELDLLRRRLDDNPIVTLTGVGGVGKTRLAQVLAEESGGPAAPAAFCELAATNEPGQVAACVAESLGFPSLDAATVGMAGQSRLLVLDSCDHVLDGVVEVVERLLSECPEVSILATSREPLELPAEHVLALDPLSLPASDEQVDVEKSPAVQLFLARAEAAGSPSLGPDSSAAIAQLCRRLDGLPLAIELAAARARSMTPAEILAHLGDRLDLLARRRGRGPARHRSLEAAIAWSYERLPDDTRVFFDRLGAFTGRFSAETALAVAAAPGERLGEVIGNLDQLVAQSLVTVHQQAGRSWYGLLETLRAFARSRLAERGELDAVQGRWVDSLVTMAEGLVKGGSRQGSFDAWVTVNTVQRDLLAALRWCLVHDDGPARAVRLFVPLWWVVYHARAEPVADLGDRFLQRWPDEHEPGWAEVTAITAFAHIVLGGLDRGRDLAEHALVGGDSPLAGVVARRAMTVRAHSLNRDEEALRWVEDAVQAAAAGGFSAWHNELQTVRAFVLASLGRTDEAVVQAKVASEGAATLDSPTLQAWATLAYGCLVAIDDPAAGRAVLEPLAKRCHAIGYPLGAGRSLRALGALAALANDVGDATRLLRQALNVFVRIGHATQVRATLRWIGFLAQAAGDGDVAAELYRAVGASPSPISDVLERTHAHRLVSTAHSDGPAVSLRDAVALARRELGILGGAARGREPADAGPAPNRFQQEGAVWTLVYGGAMARLPDAKGLHDLALLLSQPGREVSATELMGAGLDQGDAGPVLDTAARRRYEQRIVELQSDLAEAEDANDQGRAEKVRTEMDLLVDQLMAASGLSGRSRRMGSTAERARSAVTWRVRSAIKRIKGVHPDLGRHLESSVRTGTWCVYKPDSPTPWQL